MTASLLTRLDRNVDTLPRAHPGPGGAVAVLRDGEVLVRHAWGWANAERRIAFTPRTLFRICSITKQFTCALVLDAVPDPSALNADVRARLPMLDGVAPGALHLCHNQSGLRDYWAVAMLHGSPAEAPFGDAEAARVIGGTRTLQQAFVDEQAGQCGYCLSGILISAAALLARNPRPSRSEIAAALDRHLCRCGVHNRIMRAVARAGASVGALP